MSREPDLSFIQSDISLNEVRPLETKKVALLVNEFLLRTADVLNSFSGSMEEGVLKIEQKLDSLETHLQLTEKKLECIENYPDEPVPVSRQVMEPLPSNAPARDDERIAEQSTPVQAVSVPVASTPIQKEHENATTETAVVPVEATEKEVTTPAAEKSTIKISDHPTYSKYFKMVKMGVPETAVKIKMTSEGVDSSVLDDPSREVGAVETQKDSSDEGGESEDDYSSSFSSD